MRLPFRARVFLWNLGWFLPFLPPRARERLFSQITGEDRNRRRKP